MPTETSRNVNCESAAVFSRFTGLNDDCGILLLLGVVGFEEDFALLLRFINAHPFQSRFAVSEICWIESQSYLDELVADGKTVPNAAMTGSSTFRIKCGDDGFHQVSFDVTHHSSTGGLHRARTKEPRVSHPGDNFASTSSVLNKFLFGEMPYSRGCDEFYERIQIVLFTLGDLESNAVYKKTADALHAPRELEVMATQWESLNAKAELARMHQDGHCHVAMKWHVHHLPKPMNTLTLCESKADPRWKRVNEGRRPKNRS